MVKKAFLVLVFFAGCSSDAEVNELLGLDKDSNRDALFSAAIG